MLAADEIGSICNIYFRKFYSVNPNEGIRCAPGLLVYFNNAPEGGFRLMKNLWLNIAYIRPHIIN